MKHGIPVPHQRPYTGRGRPRKPTSAATSSQTTTDGANENKGDTSGLRGEIDSSQSGWVGSLSVCIVPIESRGTEKRRDPGSREGGRPETGIDGVSKAEYGVGLDQRLEGLVGCVRRREYRAPNIKRVQIPKGNGEFRPLGLLNIEDKVLQKGFVMLVEPVFEREFHDFSYGFRPGRSPHQALRALRRHVGDRGMCWVIDLDLRKYFDTIPHRRLREMFSRRIRDGVLNRLDLGWLKAGVLHEGKVTINEEGTPQGGIVSPLLSNLYLHEALDDWFAQEVQPRLKGAAPMVRFADDAVLCFARKEEAEEVLKELGERMKSFLRTFPLPHPRIVHNLFVEPSANPELWRNRMR